MLQAGWQADVNAGGVDCLPVRLRQRPPPPPPPTPVASCL